MRLLRSLQLSLSLLLRSELVHETALLLLLLHMCGCVKHRVGQRRRVLLLLLLNEDHCGLLLLLKLRLQMGLLLMDRRRINVKLVRCRLLV